MTIRLRYVYVIVALLLLVLIFRVFSASRGTAEVVMPQRVKTAQAAVRDTPSAENFNALSFQYFQAGMPAKSVEASTEAIRLNPNQAVYFNNLCAAQNDLKNYAAAIAACQSALKIDPNLQLAKNNLNWAFTHDAKK